MMGRGTDLVQRERPAFGRRDARVSWPALGLVPLLLAFGACSSSSSSGPQSTNDGGTDAGPLVDATPPHPLCVNGQSADGAYPKVQTSLELLGTIPNLSFDGLDETGNKVSVSLADYFEPCAPKSRLLVLRITTGWCGTCRYDLAHTKTLTGDTSFGARLRMLDMLVTDEDGNPATVDDLSRHEDKMDQKTGIVAEPTYRVSVIAPSVQAILPVYVLVDTRTMQIRNFITVPDPATLSFRIAQELALLDGAPAPAYPPQPLTDARFAPNEWAILSETTVPTTPPPDTTNEKADDAAAAALGKVLFSDKAFSPSGTVSCATCHDANKAFTDGLTAERVNADETPG